MPHTDFEVPLPALYFQSEQHATHAALHHRPWPGFHLSPTRKDLVSSDNNCLNTLGFRLNRFGAQPCGLLSARHANRSGRSRRRLAMGERMADAGDDAIPLLLFHCRVVDQHACDEAAGEVTAVVPDQSVTKTRYDKEMRGHLSIDDTLGRVFPPQKG